MMQTSSPVDPMLLLGASASDATTAPGTAPGTGDAFAAVAAEAAVVDNTDSTGTTGDTDTDATITGDAAPLMAGAVPFAALPWFGTALGALPTVPTPTVGSAVGDAPTHVQAAGGVTVATAPTTPTGAGGSDIALPTTPTTPQAASVPITTVAATTAPTTSVAVTTGPTTPAPTTSPPTTSAPLALTEARTAPPATGPAVTPTAPAVSQPATEAAAQPAAQPAGSTSGAPSDTPAGETDATASATLATGQDATRTPRGLRDVRRSGVEVADDVPAESTDIGASTDIDANGPAGASAGAASRGTPDRSVSAATPANGSNGSDAVVAVGHGPTIRGAVATAAATTAPSVAAPTIPDADPNVARVGQVVRMIHRNGESDGVSISLAPAELGRVKVELTTRDGQVSVHLTADHVRGADALRTASSSLRSELESDGVRLDRLGVSLGDAGAGRGQQDPRGAAADASGPDDPRRTVRAVSPAAIRSPSADATAGRRRATSADAIDLDL